MLKVLLKEYSHVDIHAGDVQTRGRNHVLEHCTGNTMALINQTSVEAVTVLGGKKKNHLTTKATWDSGNTRMWYECVNVRFHGYDMKVREGRWLEKTWEKKRRKFRSLAAQLQSKTLV